MKFTSSDNISSQVIQSQDTRIETTSSNLNGAWTLGLIPTPNNSGH